MTENDFYCQQESEGEKSDADVDPDLVVDVANEVINRISIIYLDNFHFYTGVFMQAEHYRILIHPMPMVHTLLTSEKMETKAHQVVETENEREIDHPAGVVQAPVAALLP